MEILYWFIALVAALALNAWQLYLHAKEKKELHTRLASKSVQEAEYWLKKYPKEVKQEEKQKKAELKKETQMTPEQVETKKAARGF